MGLISNLKVEVAKPTPFSRVLCIHPDDVGTIMKSGIFKDAMSIYTDPHEVGELITSSYGTESSMGRTLILSNLNMWDSFEVLGGCPISWLIIVKTSQRRPKSYARLIIKHAKNLMGDMRILLRDERDSEVKTKIEQKEVCRLESLSGIKQSKIVLTERDKQQAWLGSFDARQKWVNYEFIRMLDAFQSSHYLDKMLDLLDLISLFKKYPSINVPDRYFVNKHALKNAFDARVLKGHRLSTDFSEVLKTREMWHKHNSSIRDTRKLFVKYMSTGDLFI